MHGAQPTMKQEPCTEMVAIVENCVEMASGQLLFSLRREQDTTENHSKKLNTLLPVKQPFPHNSRTL